MSQHFDASAKAGTIGGTLLTILANINQQDLIKTAILAAVGAVVSFLVTMALKVVIRLFKR